jgi:hypothetical protein
VLFYISLHAVIDKTALTGNRMGGFVPTGSLELRLNEFPACI